MTDRDALYRSILAHPADDTPRLVYADWLEENGRAEEAEFIRLECRLEVIAPDEPSFVELLDRREELRLSLMASLPMPEMKLPARLHVAGGTEWWKTTYRGFPRFIEVDGLLDPSIRAMRAVAASLERAYALLPTRWLVVRLISVPQLAELLRHPVLTALEHLTVQISAAEDPHDEACRLIADCPRLTKLKGLVLAYPVGDAGAGWLAHSEHLSGLQQLTLDQCLRLTPAAIRALAAASWFRGLRLLDLGELDGSAFEELCRVEPLSDLHTLEVDGSTFPTASWRVFARSTTFPRLTSFRNGTEMAAGQTEAFAETDGLKIAILNMSTCGIGNDGAQALAQAPWLNSLSRLNLAFNNLTAGGIAAIAGSRRLTGLRYLDVSANAPGIGGLRAIAANPALRGLTTLLLNAASDRLAGLTSPAVYEFLATLNLPDLRHLALNHLPLGTMGTRALAAAKFGNLTRLHVAGCKLNDAAMGSLLTAPSLQNLLELDASQNDLRSGIAPLADRRVLPRLAAANFADCRIPSDLVRKLKRRPGVVA
jgi:uncharacterized protein (TIGR02996 family)